MQWMYPPISTKNFFVPESSQIVEWNAEYLKTFSWNIKLLGFYTTSLKFFTVKLSELLHQQIGQWNFDYLKTFSWNMKLLGSLSGGGAHRNQVWTIKYILTRGFFLCHMASVKVWIPKHFFTPYQSRPQFLPYTLLQSRYYNICKIACIPPIVATKLFVCFFHYLFHNTRLGIVFQNYWNNATLSKNPPRCQEPPSLHSRMCVSSHPEISQESGPISRSRSTTSLVQVWSS